MTMSRVCDSDVGEEGGGDGVGRGEDGLALVSDWAWESEPPWCNFLRLVGKSKASSVSSKACFSGLCCVARGA